MDLIKNNSRTGARVYGLPITLNLANYIDDVSSSAEDELFFTMYFAGKHVSVRTPGYNEDDF